MSASLLFRPNNVELKWQLGFEDYRFIIDYICRTNGVLIKPSSLIEQDGYYGVIVELDETCSLTILGGFIEVISANEQITLLDFNRELENYILETYKFPDEIKHSIDLSWYR